jgi:hypothetical protein
MTETASRQQRSHREKCGTVARRKPQGRQYRENPSTAAGRKPTAAGRRTRQPPVNDFGRGKRKIYILKKILKTQEPRG